jgi:S-adenosylmethionine-diacylglycerol 3-amino-3-carboxypropyl transferase
MQDVLDASPGAFDFVHASNILDWLEESDARRLLDAAARALRPGGWILVRQLNSTLDIRGLGGGFAWDESTSSSFLERDRSYFYSAIHAGVRR